ncbi:alpha/beta fold hydrolase [Nocardioides pacificus]
MSASPTPGLPSDQPVSNELFAPVSPDVELCYQTFGDPADEPLLLVMGLGGPMTWWPRELCVRLADAGFFVIRYDNRDAGRSTKLPQRVTRAQILQAFLGRPVRPPYSLSDLARDGIGLLDHLGITSAHVAGVSMGGMIVQTMAIEHPGRLRSLTSIMSTTGKRTVGWQHPRLLPIMIAPRKPGREAYAEGTIAMSKLIGSPGYPEDDAELRRRGEETYDRGVSQAGVLRQMLAILTQPSRSQPLRSLRIPAAVIHGLADKMVHVSGGRATAAAIPGAELVTIEGMGHDLPQGLFDTFVDVIRRTADRA